VCRRITERGHREPAVDAAESLLPQDVTGHVLGPVVVVAVGAAELVPCHFQLQPDLDRLNRGQDEGLQHLGANTGEGHAYVGGGGDHKEAAAFCLGWKR
jgi:hypothetical protein